MIYRFLFKPLIYSFLFLITATVSFYRLNGQSISNYEQYIVPPDSGVMFFGSSISADRDVLLIGSMSNRTDSNFSNPRSSAGAAYLYTKNSGQWSGMKKIVASDRTVGNFFGVAVDVLYFNNQYQLVIAADVGDYQTAQGSGKLYFFKQIGSSWKEEQKFSTSDANTNDRVGSEICRCEDNLFIGASGQDYNESGQSYMESSGAVYHFKLESGTWKEKQKIIAPDRADDQEEFGRSLTCNSEFLVVGSLNGTDENDANYKSRSGSVYIFKEDINANWILHQKIKASDANTNDGFGMLGGMSIANDYLAIGSGNSFDENGKNEIPGAGSVYIFKKNGSGYWDEKQKIVALHRQTSAEFGQSLSLTDSIIAVGAQLDQTDEQNQNPLSSEGAVYLFKLNSNQTWNFEEKLVAPTRRAGSYFGSDLTINSNNLLIAAERDKAGRQVSNGAAHYFSLNVLTGIRSLQKDEEVKVFPNPSSGFVSVQSEQRIKFVEVYNSQGKKVLSQFGPIEQLDLSKLPKSIYIIRVATENEVFDKKIIRD